MEHLSSGMIDLTTNYLGVLTMVSTTRVMMTGFPTRLQACISVFWTRAIFSGSTSSPRFPRLRMMPSASLRMPYVCA